jgi:lipoate-protein ligase A
MDWRFLPFERYDPYFKTGLNQALMESVAESGEPIVFLAGWDSKCVNIGRSQELEERVNVEKCREDGVKIVRRQGGGGTTYLTPEGELTWGVVAPSGYFSEDVNRVYEKFCGKVAEALGGLGVEAWHEPVNDVVTSNGKISGATLKRSDGVTYVGGTLLLDVNPEEMFRYINPDPEKNERHGLEDFRDRVTSLEIECGASRKEAEEALETTLLKGLEYSKRDLTDEECSRAEKLAEKYSSEDWIQQ